MVEDRKIRVGLIGFGYWGLNIARNFHQNPNTTLSAICDISPKNQARAEATYPDVTVNPTPEQMISDGSIDAIAIASPASTHGRLGEAVLKAGKHLLITKPVTTTFDSAFSLATSAERSGKVLLVDHTFLYSEAIFELKKILKNGVIGRPLYYDSMRTGLGIFKTDADIIDDLAIHDLAIIDYLFQEKPIKVSGTWSASIPGHLPCLAYLNLQYLSGLHVHIAANWLSPIKQRKVIVAGDCQMVCWDETQSPNSMQIFDSGVSPRFNDVVAGRAALDYRHGVAHNLELASTEALANEVQDFVECIWQRREPISGGWSAARVMCLAEAARRSANAGGAPIDIEW